jgi:hypothetical protein
MKRDVLASKPAVSLQEKLADYHRGLGYGSLIDAEPCSEDRY